MAARFLTAVAVLALSSCGQTAKNRVMDGTAGTGGSLGGAGAPAGPDECVLSTPPDVPGRLLHDFELKNELERFGEPLGTLTPTPYGSRLVSEDFQIPIQQVQVEQLILLSERIGERYGSSTDELANLIGCDVTKAGEETCRDALIDFVTQQLFRGLGSLETTSELNDVFDMGVELGGDFASGVRAVLEVALQSPELLYRFEQGESAPDKGDGWLAATDFELASRLSFLLWDRGPDAELLTEAERGKLRTPSQIEAQARRLLADGRAREPVRRFYRDLLGVPPQYDVNPTEFPDFRPEIAALIAGEYDAFVDDATFAGVGDFRALFEPVSWLNGPLATYYGIAGITGDAFQRVTLDPKRYAGLLTQPAWLNNGPWSSTNPVTRGSTISVNLLCHDIPPEPADLVIPLPEPLPPGPLTTRERYSLHSKDAACAGCHRHMDPIGFALEHFDASGRWRDTEDGLPIDATGEIIVTDAAGKFDGAAELSARIAGSQDARDCYATKWARFAYGKAAADANTCVREELIDRFHESGDNVVELLVALTQTDSFRYLAPVPETGK